MTAPTQAQIEAAKAELRRIFQDAYTDDTLTIAAKAVLAAAAAEVAARGTRAALYQASNHRKRPVWQQQN